MKNHKNATALLEYSSPTFSDKIQILRVNFAVKSATAMSVSEQLRRFAGSWDLKTGLYVLQCFERSTLSITVIFLFVMAFRRKHFLFYRKSQQTVYIPEAFRVVQKNAQSSMHRHFATVRSRITQFSPKC